MALDKQDFYHGAAIIQLIAAPDFKNIQKVDYGYVLNANVNIVMKYTTKSNSPWGFSVDLNEIAGLGKNAAAKVVFAFVCGGDGVCAILLSEMREVCSEGINWISIRRGFHGQYALSGPLADFSKRIPQQRWPSLVFSIK